MITFQTLCVKMLNSYTCPRIQALNWGLFIIITFIYKKTPRCSVATVPNSTVYNIFFAVFWLVTVKYCDRWSIICQQFLSDT